MSESYHPTRGQDILPEFPHLSPREIQSATSDPTLREYAAAACEAMLGPLSRG